MTWSDLPEEIRYILHRLTDAGWAAYPVGGCVRDLLLGRRPGDVDVCTAARPETVLELFPDAIPTGLKHGTVTVPVTGGGVEITTFRREGGYADGRHPDAVSFDAGLQEDLSRRDFTVNAMALAEDGRIIDLFGGRADLAAGLLRCVGEPDRRFSEDALRMLRGIRFAAQLDFRVEERTAAALEKNAFRVSQVSRERIRTEMEKTLLSPRPELIGTMAEAGLLDHLYTFPEHCPWETLTAVPAEPAARWRQFCRITGFPISALPVERRLRRAVEHPELDLIPLLALDSGALMARGLIGRSLGEAQKRLALHILDHPEDNTPAVLAGVLDRSEHT